MDFCEYCEIFKNKLFIEHLWWLLNPYEDIVVNKLLENSSLHYMQKLREKSLLFLDKMLFNPFAPNAPFLYPINQAEHKFKH